jgi:PAS domain S-box-containing protein
MASLRMLLISFQRIPGSRYLCAVLSVAFILAVRYALYSFLGNRFPFPFFFAAASFAAWYGGFGPGFVTLVLGYIAAMALFVTPENNLYKNPVLGSFIVLIAGSIMVALCASLRGAQLRAEANAREVLARQKQLEEEIIERRRSERLALDQQRELSVILHSIGDAVIVADSDGCVQLMNPLAEELTGWPSAEARGQRLDEVFPVRDEADRTPAPSDAVDSCGDQSTLYASSSKILTSRRGVCCPIDQTRAPIRDDRGNITGVVVVFRDVTARHAAERTREEQERRKDEFLAMLAHELRNPLAPIAGALHVLEIAPDDATTAVRARQIMQRQVDHLVRLVDDLLDVSRITRGKIGLQRTRVELAEVIQRAVETTRPHIDAQRHRLVIDLPSEPVMLDADPIRLAQVLGNLLNNAAKYTEPGGLIELCAARDGEKVEIRVRDNGLGMSPEMLPRIFDLFVQERHSLDRAQGGLGIGLTLVRRLVELHGGSVEACSPGVGQGSEFVVRLPLAGETICDHAGAALSRHAPLVARPA